MESKEQRRVRTLIEQLGHPKQAKAWRARDRLAAIGSAAVEPLIEVLRSPSVHVRLEAMTALASIGDSRAFEAILEMLHDPDDFVCYEAAWALGELGDERAIAPLIELLKEYDGGGDAPGGAAQFIHLLGEKAVAPLVQLLSDTDADIRAIVVYCLAGTESSAAFDTVAGLLEDPDEDVRCGAVDSLALMADKNPQAYAAVAIDLIGPRTDDPSEKVREEAAYWLSDLRDQLAKSARKARKPKPER